MARWEKEHPADVSLLAAYPKEREREKLFHREMHSLSLSLFGLYRDFCQGLYRRRREC